jgi:hypothetical protein
MKNRAVDFLRDIYKIMHDMIKYGEFSAWLIKMSVDWGKIRSGPS